MFTFELGSVKNQLLTTLYCNIIAINHGAVLGWFSPSIGILQSDMSPLSTGAITIEDTSWILSLQASGAFVGNIMYGCISSYVGKKICLLSLAAVHATNWLLVRFATNPYYIYAARLLGGIGCSGLLLLGTVFIVEIADDKIRGFLVSSIFVMANFGILLTFIIGSMVSYNTLATILIVLPVLFAITFIFIPETPQALYEKGKYKYVKKSIRFFKNIRWERNMPEPSRLQLEFDKVKTRYEAGTKNFTQIKLSDFTHPEARKALFIGIILMILAQFCGVFSMMTYASAIFQEAGSTLTPNDSSIIIAILQLCTILIANILTDTVGRKILMLVSCSGITVGLSIFSLYSYYKTIGGDMNYLNWIPLACFSFSIISGTLGTLTISFVIVSEILPQKIRTIGSSICLSFLWISSFTVAKFLPIVIDTYGMHVPLTCFAVCSFAGAVFVYFVVPETKGKSFEEIREALRSKASLSN